MKRVIQWMKVRKYSAIFIGICALLFAVYLSISFWLPRYLKPLLTRYIAKQNIHVEIKKIDSYFPIKVRCDTFQYELAEFASIEMKDITLSMDLFFLFKRTFRVDDFLAKTGVITIKKSQSQKQDFSWPEPFFGVSISSLKVDKLTILRENEPQVVLSLDASAKVTPRGDNLNLDGIIEQKSPYQEKLRFNFSGQKRTKYLTLEAKFQERNRGFLVTYLKNILPIEKATLSISASGHLNHWASLFLKDPMKHVVLFPKIKGSANGDITFRSDADLSIAPLLQGKAEFKTRFSFTSDRIIDFEKLEFITQNIDTSGNVEYNFKENAIKNALFTTTVKRLNPIYQKYGLSSSTPLHIQLNLNGPIGKLTWQLKFKQQKLQFRDSMIQNLVGNIRLNEAGLKGGMGSMSFKMEQEQTTLSFQLNSADQKDVQIKNIELHSPLIDIKGTGRFSFHAHDLTNLNLFGIIDDDNLFKSYLPEVPRQFVFDRLEGTMMYEKDPFSNLATAKMDVSIERPEFRVLHAYAGKASFTIDDLFNEPKFHIGLQLQNGKVYKTPFETLDLSTEYGSYENYYFIKMKQGEISNLNLQSKGFWYRDEKTFYFNISEFNASIFETRLELDKRVNLALSQNHIYLSPTLIHANDGFIWMQASKQDQKGLVIKTQNAPIGLISFVSERLNAKGTVTGDITIQNFINPTMHSTLRFEDVKIDQAGWTLIDANFVALDTSFVDWNFNYALDMRYKQDYLRSNGKIPFEKSSYLPSLKDPFKVELQMEDNTTHLLEYLNAQGHSIRGDIVGDMILTGTLARPQIDGRFRFQKGTYENYATGLLLQNLNFELIGRAKRLLLENFSARDHLNGNTQARGYIEFIYSNYFPFSLNVRFEDMTVLDVDNAIAQVTGLTSLNGNFREANLSGKLDVTTATLSLSDRIKNPIPRLPLTFVNKRAPTDFSLFTPKLVLNLDLSTDILGTLRLRGRGLNSKWRGAVITKGTLDNPLVYGKVQYDEGFFKFAGHEFKFTQGEINFDGSPTKDTSLNLQAVENLGDLTVTITFRGPLSSPVLNLSSSPDLPTSMILSKLLFNKDISEIDSFQAIKLAQTALELSSGDLGILEKIQASTGLDRLAITQAPTVSETSAQMQQTEDEEIGAVAVQVGKYITKGVLVTTTQGTTAEARSYSVEIDLKYNLILQLEANQQRDGKLSLKWSKSY